MSTITKTFEFAVDTEGWVATPGDARVDMAWKTPNHAGVVGPGVSHLLTPPNSIHGGSLRSTAMYDAGSSENYWEWSGTWEDLGVPSGGTVTDVNLDYLYRWQQKKASVTFLGTETGSGPAELRDSGGTLIDTFSTRVFCIDMPSPGAWRSYPQSPGYPFTPTYHGDYPISATPPSWGLASGSSISVPAPQQPSSTTIKLRLRNLLPATPSPADVANHVRHKQDHVVVTITYTTGGGGSSVKTINNLAIASVKTVNGLAIASVKTFDGLA